MRSTTHTRQTDPLEATRLFMLAHKFRDRSETANMAAGALGFIAIGVLCRRPSKAAQMVTGSMRRSIDPHNLKTSLFAATAASASHEVGTYYQKKAESCAAQGAEINRHLGEQNLGL